MSSSFRDLRVWQDAFRLSVETSLLELQTQGMIAQELKYISEEESTALLDEATRVGRSLAGLINAVRSSQEAGANDQRPKTMTNDHYV